MLKFTKRFSLLSKSIGRSVVAIYVEEVLMKFVWKTIISTEKFIRKVGN
jgi:hypothetical protein